MRIKHWKMAKYDEGMVKQLSQSTKLPVTVCKVLSARNPNYTLDEIDSFLESNTDFESPFNLIDMDLAVERIFAAIENQEKIAIYGDYDCDGITSTALLLNYFQSVGADAFFYIPHRESEGYGMNMEAIDYLHSKETELIITVDNGISSHNEIEYAAQLGMEVVITDHHTPRETLPKAVAVVNPHRADCHSRFKDYAGVGVVFQLVCALEDADPEELLEYYADLVTIGTVADLVTLHNENRTIVNRGIESINEHSRVGIKALLDVANIKTPITSESISFGISPRINAAGRVGDVKEAIELLVTEDPERATEIAQTLGQHNLQRRGIEEAVLKEIFLKLEERPERSWDRVLIVWGEDWHQGVMGIVASRLMERFGKPCIVFSLSNGIAKGSGRSLEGYSLIEAITACNKHLTHYGGHTLAAGMTIAEEHLEDFYSSIQEFSKANYELMPVPSYSIDCELKSGEATIENIKKFDVLAPFGSGNPPPIFVMKHLELTGIYPTSDEKHMRLRFNLEGKEINCIYFRMTPSRFHFKEGQQLDAVVDVDINEWNGALQLSVKIKDLRLSDYPEREVIVATQVYAAFKRGEENNIVKKSELIPTREELEITYKYIRALKDYPYSGLALWEGLVDKQFNLARFLIALDIFEESGLISRHNGGYRIVDPAQKADIRSTETYKKLEN